MNREVFNLEIGPLNVLKGAPASLDSHFAALCDLPVETLESAVTHALRTRAWFPAPAELRLDADATVARTTYQEPVRVMPLADARTVHIPNPFGGAGITVQVTTDWWDDCDVCRDTGLAEYTCGAIGKPWVPSRDCERREAHGPHSWVQPCGCVLTNPTIRRRKERQRVAAGYSQEPERVGAR